MILHPDFTPTLSDPANAEDNRWYRLFQYLEVPSRVNRMVGNYISTKRLPGKLNPNMIRHREVYAGLLDDVQFLNTNPLGDYNANGDEDGPFSAGSLSNGVDGVDGMDPFITPSVPANVEKRDRWLEFINERDGNVPSVKDPTPLLVGSGDESNKNYWIPGAPNSRPFRSFSSRNANGTDDNAIEATLFRRLGLDKDAVSTGTRSNVAGEGNAAYQSGGADIETNRHWLEVGNRDYHKTNTGAAAATMVEHHQQLSKILNNTTTVSNTFIMYGTAAYFEVTEDANGIAQIGGRMGLDLDGDGDPTNDAGWEERAVFILDRTELYNAYDPGSGSVDWKRLVKHRIDLTSDGK